MRAPIRLRKFVAGNVFDLIVSALIVVVLLVALQLTLDMSFRGRLFPQAIIVPTLVLALFQLASTVLRTRGTTSRPQAEVIESSEVSAADEAKRTLRLYGWLAGWLVAIWAIGFIPAAGLGVLVYTLVESRRPWWQCVLLGSGTWLFLFVVIDRIMHQLLPRGEILRLLGA